MWTPKRILILVGGLIFFLIGFAVYTYFLGAIDGLPPLPDRVSDPPPPMKTLSWSSPISVSAAEPPITFWMFLIPPLTCDAVPVARFTVTEVVYAA